MLKTYGRTGIDIVLYFLVSEAQFTLFNVKLTNMSIVTAKPNLTPHIAFSWSSNYHTQLRYDFNCPFKAFLSDLLYARTFTPNKKLQRTI